MQYTNVLSLIKKELKYLDPRQSWGISSEYTFIFVIIYPMYLYISASFLPREPQLYSLGLAGGTE